MLAASTLLGGAARDAVFGAYLRRHGLISWLSLAVMFVAMLSAARSAGGRELLVRALVIGAAWPAAYLLMQRAGIDVVQWIAPNEGHQSGSTFGNHVFVGGYLALVIPLTILQSWQSHWTWSAEEIARASIEWAVRSAPPPRDQLLQQARAAYERALELDPANPVHSRHLAAYFRIRAAFLEGAAREDALVEADRIYERVSQWAPALTPVWVEWAWVDVDRGRSREALVKLERALQLEPQRGEAQQLRADLLAGRPPVNARRQEMSQQ